MFKEVLIVTALFMHLAIGQVFAGQIVFAVGEWPPLVSRLFPGEEEVFAASETPLIQDNTYVIFSKNNPKTPVVKARFNE